MRIYKFTTDRLKTSVTKITESSFATIHLVEFVANVAQGYDCELFLAYLAIDVSGEVVFFNIDDFVLHAFLEKHLLL